MKRWAAAAAVVLISAHAAAAQPAPVSSDPQQRESSLERSDPNPPVPAATPLLAQEAERPQSEWVIGAGAAWAIRIFQSKGDRWYAVQTVSWGRELTRDLGPGVLRGRFAWAIEATPIFAQVRPTHVYGFGVAPVLWRWNFVPRRRWSAFGELAMGGLWSSAPVPEGTKRANFTAHWGGGVRIAAGGRGLVLAYRLQHISNGNQLQVNPGVNSHVLFVGLSSRRFPPHRS